MNILILTYNRLPYLQKCIWSILASTKGRYKITVLDDNSTDGSREWLLSMQQRKKIQIIFPNKKLGSAKGFNQLVSNKIDNEQWFTFCNDDMWFMDNWLERGMEIIKRYDDCGMVSLYNYSAVKKNVIKDCGNEWLLEATGLGATIMNKNLWVTIGGFKLPDNAIMGFFASKFCNNALRCNGKHKLYMPKVPVVLNMDMVSSVLNERDVLTEYGKFRVKNKR